MAEETKPAEGDRATRVLVVEDESIISMSLGGQLRALGCEVVGAARDAAGAIEMARRLRPDLVLMDLGLAGQNGVEAIRAIMEEAPTRVIVITAYGDDRVRRAREAGAQLVLTKPVLVEQLAMAIKQVMAAG